MRNRETHKIFDPSRDADSGQIIELLTTKVSDYNHN